MGVGTKGARITSRVLIRSACADSLPLMNVKQRYELCLKWLLIYGDRRLPFDHQANAEYLAVAKRVAFKRDGLLAHDRIWRLAWDDLATRAQSNGWTQ